MTRATKFNTLLPVGLCAAACLLALYPLLWKSPVGAPTAGEGLRWTAREEKQTGRNDTVPILLYHNIDGKGVFSILLPELRGHFQLLRNKGIRVIGLSDFIERLENPSPFEEPAVALSFDDGYPAMRDKLLPLAIEYSYPVTLFVYANNVYARSTKNLSWNALRELDRRGIDIQSHSISHPDLVKLARRDSPENRRRLFDEIYVSKRIFELHMGKRIRYFAFPYGRYDERTVRLCQYAGYERVFSTDYGTNLVTRNNYCLRRHHIKSSFGSAYIEKLVE